MALKRIYGDENTIYETEVVGYIPSRESRIELQAAAGKGNTVVGELQDLQNFHFTYPAPEKRRDGALIDTYKAVYYTVKKQNPPIFVG